MSDLRVGTFISNRTDQRNAGTLGNRKKDSNFFRMALFISWHFLFADSSFSSDSPNPPENVQIKN